MMMTDGAVRFLVVSVALGIVAGVGLRNLLPVLRVHIPHQELEHEKPQHEGEYHVNDSSVFIHT